MPTTGPNFPTAATGNTATIGGGSVAWTSPTNIEVSDGVFATAVLNASVSDDLIGTGFGFAIAGTDTINGILLEVNYKSSVSGPIEANVRLLKAGTAAGTDKSTGASLPTVVTTVSYGSAADLWGTTWTPADVNNTSFGAATVYNNVGALNRTVSVDFFRITITSTAASGGVRQASMMVMF
jgi:hypothetical protein